MLCGAWAPLPHREQVEPKVRVPHRLRATRPRHWLREKQNAAWWEGFAHRPQNRERLRIVVIVHDPNECRKVGPFGKRITEDVAANNGRAGR